ncbi:hypothetical protein YC2023_082598 [Brassica napus]
MTDPSYEDDKIHRRYMDMLKFIADSGNGIPQRCPCDGQIIIQAIEQETQRLTRKVDDHERKIRRLNSIEYCVSSLEEDEKKNAEDIEELKYFLKNRYPNDFY